MVSVNSMSNSFSTSVKPSQTSFENCYNVKATAGMTLAALAKQFGCRISDIIAQNAEKIGLNKTTGNFQLIAGTTYVIPSNSTIGGYVKSEDNTRANQAKNNATAIAILNRRFGSPDQPVVSIEQLHARATAQAKAMAAKSAFRPETEPSPTYSEAEAQKSDQAQLAQLGIREFEPLSLRDLQIANGTYVNNASTDISDLVAAQNTTQTSKTEVAPPAPVAAGNSTVSSEARAELVKKSVLLQALSSTSPEELLGQSKGSPPESPVETQPQATASSPELPQQIIDGSIGEKPEAVIRDEDAASGTPAELESPDNDPIFTAAMNSPFINDTVVATYTANHIDIGDPSYQTVQITLSPDGFHVESGSSKLDREIEEKLNDAIDVRPQVASYQTNIKMVRTSS